MPLGQGLGVRLASALQVGIEEEIHGVELMSCTAHVHRGRLARGGDRSKVGVNVVLPQTNAGENVRRHVQGVRSRRRNLRVSSRGGNAELRQLRLVVAVDQVVCNSWMIGLSSEQFFQHGGCLPAFGERCVLVRVGGEQGQRIERRGFVIVGI